MDEAKSQISELLGENEELRNKQKDFYGILQDKIGGISEELKMERERRLQSQNHCKVQEERVLELEARLRGQKKHSMTAAAVPRLTESSEVSNTEVKKRLSVRFFKDF